MLDYEVVLWMVILEGHFWAHSHLIQVCVWYLILATSYQANFVVLSPSTQ